MDFRIYGFLKDYDLLTYLMITKKLDSVIDTSYCSKMYHSE